MKDLRNKMQDFALESKINCGQAQGTKDNPGVVGNIAHTVKAEAHTAKVEAHTAKVEAQTAKAEARTAKAEAQTAKAEAHTAIAEAQTAKAEAHTATAEAQTAKAEAHTATAEAQAAKEKVDTLAKDLEKFQHHYWTICRGEIVSAAMVLLGYSPNGRYTKTGFVRHVQKNLAEYLLFVQDKLPGITPSEFQNMVHILSPQPENHHINSRNSAAHQFSIDQARLSVQGRRYTHLLRWVDMLAAFEKDGNACISDVAFDYAYLCDGKSLEQDELVTSILTALKHASEDDKIEFSRLIGSFRDLQVRQESLENEEDEEALLKASNIPFIPLE